MFLSLDQLRQPFLYDQFAILFAKYVVYLSFHKIALHK